MLSGYFRYAVRMLPEWCPDVAEIRKKSLESIFGDKYLWVRELGGDLNIESEDFKLSVTKIIDFVEKDQKKIMLMCCERDYRKCVIFH